MYIAIFYFFPLIFSITRQVLYVQCLSLTKGSHGRSQTTSACLSTAANRNCTTTSCYSHAIFSLLNLFWIKGSAIEFDKQQLWNRSILQLSHPYRGKSLQSSNMEKSFGRDEMNALLGGPQNNEDLASFRPSMAQPHGNKRMPNQGPDISTMTAAEAAALLTESSSSGPSAAASRYRTNKVLAHHELAKELSEEVEITRLNPIESKEVGDESEDDFVSQKWSAIKRERIAQRTKEEPQVIQRKRPTYDSSSSSESDGSDNKRRSRRQRDSDDSSSDDSSGDEEEDRRRRILLSRRERKEPELVIPKSKADTAERSSIHVPIREDTNSLAPSEGPRRSHPQRTKPKRQKEIRESSSSEDGDDSSGSSSDESSSDSSSEEEQIMAKPIFVPKHKRNLIQSEEKKWEEEEARQQREKDLDKKRKMESRLMVAKQMAAVNDSVHDDDMDEESGGATNVPPNDDDEVDRGKERDAWELRELGRLLLAMDQQKRREMEELEYQRRRQMTDEQCLLEDTKAGRYQAPGSSRQGQPTGNFMQRFYHRGAYYMDEEEWDESDVRHKAAHYARSATGDDKIDKTQLPDVMKVKSFGFANQTRYKGLANEDTTDKTLRVLPLIAKKKDKKQTIDNW